MNILEEIKFYLKDFFRKDLYAYAFISPEEGEIPLTVLFTGTSRGKNKIIKYEWDFDGDGIFD
ncbi:MAG: PKD domain-containing protein [Candidatus Methanofastidiosia archaeon]